MIFVIPENYHLQSVKERIIMRLIYTTCAHENTRHRADPFTVSICQKAQQISLLILTYGLALPEADVEQRVALLRAHVVNHVFDAQLSLLTRQERRCVITTCSSQHRRPNDATLWSID